MSSSFENLLSHEKPREKLKIYGAKKLSDQELLALIIQTGTKRNSVMQLAQILLENFGNLSVLFSANLNQLLKVEGIGEATALKLIAIGEIVNGRLEKSEPFNRLTTPQEVYRVVKYLESEKQEYLVVICIDTKGFLISFKEIFKGSINQINFQPREIFNYAIESMASSIIICHNHPSGDATASEEDILATKKLIEISRIIGIPITDHLIVGNNQFYSIREKYGIIF